MGRMSKQQTSDPPKKTIVEVTFFPGLNLTGTFGTYVIEAFISSGSYSKVFTAYRQDTKEKYAIKFMNTLLDGMMEAKLLLTANELDPRYRNHLCKICDVVDLDNVRNVGLVIERGASNLLDVMNANDLAPLHIRHVKTIMYQLFCALEGLHSIHILHADVKPENILLRETTKIFIGKSPNNNKLSVELMDLHIMLCDFNCAKYLPNWVRKSNETIQTFHYRAPEIALNIQPNETIDIFSAGAMLAELASGFIVFDLESKNLPSPGVDERAKHLRLMEREMGLCPQEVYQKSADKFFSGGQWIKKSALAPSHSWFKDWREEISITGTEEQNALLEVIDRTMTWPHRRLNAQEAAALPFFEHFHRDNPRDKFYENMKLISAGELLNRKGLGNAMEDVCKPEQMNCDKTIKIEEDISCIEDITVKVKPIEDIPAKEKHNLRKKPIDDVAVKGKRNLPNKAVEDVGAKEKPNLHRKRNSIPAKPLRRWPAKPHESVNTNETKKRRTK